MKNSFLKYTNHAFYATVLVLLGMTTISAAEQSRADLLAQLIVRLGPEKAAEFMARLEQKHTAQKPAVQTSTPKVTPPAEVGYIPEPLAERPVSKPAVTQGLTEQEHIKFDDIITKFENYTHGIYKCIEAFFNKRNIDPYKSHVQCFKSQLQYLREELLRQYPKAESPEGAKLFKALETIGRSLDKSQEVMCNTLEANYGTGMFAGTKLGLAMSGMSKLMDSQRATVDKEIGIIRNLLRNAHEQEMLKKINTLYTNLNRNFDFGNNKKYDELLSILNHRVKR